MTESRLAGVRAQVRTVRRFTVAGSVVAFALLVAFARASHPGASTHATGTGTGSNTTSTQTGFEDDDSSSTFGFGTGDIGPSSGGSAQVQSGGS